ncbi:hypothetical protein D3C80_1175150 [compost metagenome]
MFFVRVGFFRFEFRAVFDPKAHPQANDAERQSQQERNTPTPISHLRVGQPCSCKTGDGCGEPFTELCNRRQEGNVQRATIGWSPLTDVAGRAADFTASREALQHAKCNEENRGPDADLRIARQQADECRGSPHQGDARNQACSTSYLVPEPAERYCANRADKKCRAEDQEGVEQPCCRIVRRKEDQSKGGSKVSVDAEVVILNERTKDGCRSGLLGFRLTFDSRLRHGDGLRQRIVVIHRSLHFVDHVHC